jgi:hypothetical protein
MLLNDPVSGDQLLDVSHQLRLQVFPRQHRQIGWRDSPRDFMDSLILHSLIGWAKIRTAGGFKNR